jgi:hypothetical protein
MPGAESCPGRRPDSGFPLTSTPNLTEPAAAHVLQPGYRYGNEFEIGLDPTLNAPRERPPRP